jgi:hypothetical protein
MVGLVVYYTGHVDVEWAFLATGGAAVMTYEVGCVAGIRPLSEGRAQRVLPWVSLIVSVALLPFIGPLTASVPAAVLGFPYGSLGKKKS